MMIVSPIKGLGQEDILSCLYKTLVSECVVFLLCVNGYLESLPKLHFKGYRYGITNKTLNENANDTRMFDSRRPQSLDIWQQASLG